MSPQLSGRLIHTHVFTRTLTQPTARKYLDYNPPYTYTAHIINHIHRLLLHMAVCLIRAIWLLFHLTMILCDLVKEVISLSGPPGCVQMPAAPTLSLQLSDNSLFTAMWTCHSNHPGVICVMGDL